MIVHLDARLTPLGREPMAPADRTTSPWAHAVVASPPRRTSRGCRPADGCQMGAPVPGRRRRGAARSFVAIPPAAPADAAGHGRSHRRASPPTPDRQAHRPPGRRVHRHRQLGARTGEAVACDRPLGVTVTRVMTDNGACYRSEALASACRALGLRHVFTDPCAPRSEPSFAIGPRTMASGKAERFVQTAIREWAYARSYDTSQERANRLPRWTHIYNRHRPHGGVPPFHRTVRLGLSVSRNSVGERMRSAE